MYSRFKALEEFGEQGQQDLEHSTAAVIGVGATGSAIAENLARHGINLIIVDRDYLEKKDVYSSSLYTPEQCEESLPKAEAAKRKLDKFTNIEAHTESLSPQNTDIISEMDIILDGTDNLETRKLINDYSKKEDIPWIYTAAIAQEAYSMAFTGKCFNCIVGAPQKVSTCETDGIMREVAQRAATASSEKAVRYLTDKTVSESLDILHQSRGLEVENSGCEVCEGKNFPHLDKQKGTAQVCGSGKFQLEKGFSLEDVRDIDVGEKVAENDFLVRFLYEGASVVFFDSGRVIAEGEDAGHAEARVSKMLGI